MRTVNLKYFKLAVEAGSFVHTARMIARRARISWLGPVSTMLNGWTMSETQSTLTAESTPLKRKLLTLTLKIASAHVRHNMIQTNALPDLIRMVYEALFAVGTPGETENAEKPAPAVPTMRSVFIDYMICLEVGKNSRCSSATLGLSMA